ncbi:hypothetical protein Lalb_Chr22g0356011 [Lupinus albus]|uniref:Uncharacterized protein n=1 Tax=Lupinus albus TaxID=3870 RepID=A0A6A4N8T3_LUPAL|nr:hypothetical protein Lalb_Chr22g0356011 [Lupinus albus]
MRTVSGNCVSSKQISLSKAAKILSKFVSADNGASQVTSAYLHRADAAFHELKHLHKELNSPLSRKKHKENHYDSGSVVVNCVHSFENNLELNNGRRFDNENVDADGEKSIQTVAKFSQEFNGSNGYDEGTGGIEKHKKNKKKRDVESRHDGDSRVKFEEREGEGKLPTSLGREQSHDSTAATEKGKKQKKEKRKDKEGNGKLSNSVENEIDDNTRMEEGKKPKKEHKDKEDNGSLSKKKMKKET